jgi:NAD-dependent SIR2 family protein deacetylase
MAEGDKTFSCTDCGEGFIWTVREQEYYKKKGFFEPKRCKDCVAKRKMFKAIIEAR